MDQEEDHSDVEIDSPPTIANGTNFYLKFGQNFANFPNQLIISLKFS